MALRSQDYLLKGKANKDLLERTLCYAIQRQQITCENRRLMEELRHLTRFDPLTGILNRQAFAEVLELEWRRAERHSHPLSCVMLDIDFFKQINDTYGHAAGDAALKRVAATIKEHGRNEDYVARYGGEEFCVLLTETPEEAAAAWAERLRETLATEAVPTNTGAIRLTASFGVATRLEPRGDVNDLLERADQALFMAKQMGRNQVVTFGRIQRLMDSRLQELTARFEGVLAGEMMLPLSLAVVANRSLRDVIADMLRHQVDMVAVIDEQGNLVGRIAENDLVAQLFAVTKDDLVAADVMQKAMGCFAEDTPMTRICEFFGRAGCSRVFVVVDQRPVGVITAGKVLQWLSDLDVEQTSGRDDATLDSLLGESQSEPHQLRRLIETNSPTAGQETVGKVSLLRHVVNLGSDHVSHSE
jgi:diguanylate cyclase (GGDEF)-like protein